MYKTTKLNRMYYNTSDRYLYALKLNTSVPDGYSPIGSDLVRLIKIDGLEGLLGGLQ